MEQAVKLDSPAWRKHIARRLHASDGHSMADIVAPSHRIAHLAPASASPPSQSAQPASAQPAHLAAAQEDAAVPHPACCGVVPPNIPPGTSTATHDIRPTPRPSDIPTSALPPLELHGVRSRPSSLFKLRGSVGGTAATFLLDSGASTDFIDPAFAQKCGLTLSTSDRTVRLADGTVVAASGSAATTCTLASANGAPFTFNSTLTATPLGEYDAILGMSWLSTHDPLIGFRNRSITIRDPASPKKQWVLRPLEVVSDTTPEVAQLATISMGALRKAMRRGEIEELFVVHITETDDAAPTTATGAPSGTGRATTLPASPGDTLSPVTDPVAKGLVKEFADVFPAALTELAPERGVAHRIELMPGSRPPAARPLRHQSAKDLGVMDEYLKEGVRSGQLRPSKSPYGSIALIVRKKDGTPRVVIDYRALNEVTIKNKYPLPLMSEMFDRVHGAKFFSKIDLRSGFHQIRLAEEDCEKTAFRTRYGSYEYTVLPMGLCNAPGTFMQLMNDTFREFLDKCVLVFLDDILIFSKTREQHERDVRAVLERLRREKLYAKLSKCEFFKEEVEFLGHRIGAKGLAVSPDKIDAVRDWPPPRNVKDVQSFLGLAGFYRRFVKDFSKLALPITELTKGENEFAWTARHDEAFAALKRALCSAPVLLIPDPTKPYTLNCDASDFAIGSVLQQDHGQGLQPVAYRSKKLTPAERNYDTREKEFLALVDACSHFRPYLHSDLPFTLLTDHDSLKYHKTMPHISGRLARWIEKMAEFDYTIAHIPGVKNIPADAVSRRFDLKGEPTEANAWGSKAGTDALNAVLRRPPMTADAVAAARVAARAAATTCPPPDPDRPLPNSKGAIVMPAQQCTAATRKGPQCRAFTAKGQYCWNHLRSIEGLRIKKSSIPGAGLGLFADRDLPKGTRIDYTGDRVPLASERDGGVYFLQITQHAAIDAARTNCGQGRWVNDPRGSDQRQNSEFVLYTPPGRPRQACVRTRRPIQKGEEILIKYGGAYWRYQGVQSNRQRKAAQRARPHARMRARDNDALNNLTSTQLSSSLTDVIRSAATADSKYAALVAAPPTGFEAVGGLLWKGTRLCVPDDRGLRTRILSDCHDSVTGAHFGRDKTLQAVKARFHWDGLTTMVEEYVATCDACQRNKPSQQATPGALMPLPLPERPCMEWTQDAVTGLPKTWRGHDAIQVYIERLCKIKHFAATRSTDGASELAASFRHHVIRPHGIPEVIISDRDPRFTAHFYAELTKLLGITLRMSTARHAQTDGQSEREIRTLITALRAFCNEHQNDWDDYLDMLELGFNTTAQASTKASPYELLYGTRPRIPIDVALDDLGRSHNPAALDRAQRMRQAFQHARDSLLTAQERQAANANRHRRSAAFSVGDQVLLSTEGLTLRDFTNKLCSRFVGPFLITRVVNANAYTLQLPPQLRALHPTFNIDKLKAYRDGRATFPDRPQPFNRPPPAAVADSNGDEVWKVERIIASRKRGRAIEYLTAWEGYPPEENTWEPRSSFDARLLAEFHRSHND